MTEFIRRIVSGNKARFKDDGLKLELDLVYVTDRVIIMGYPASGIEGLYRNHREDAKRFLESRHGKNFWVFNFCPLKENSYDVAFFDGRVSRYPFPDHHAPPLAILPLVAREMHAWLGGSPERVAVLHCKAGKGRSGTMACTYLLSLEESTNRHAQDHHAARLWAEKSTQRNINVLPDPDADQADTKKKPPLPRVFESPSDAAGILDSGETGSPPVSLEDSSSRGNSEISFTDALKGVLDLHTARRMKPPSEGKKAKQGVSIPSQRRWLNYWALILAHAAPPHLWAESPSPVSPEISRTLSPTPSLSPKSKLAFKPKVRLTHVRLRMFEPSGVHNLVKAANVLLERAAKNPPIIDSNTHSANQVWASLARYDDELVKHLEKWEAYTRDESGTMGKRRVAFKTGKTDGSRNEIVSFEEEEAGMERLFDAAGRWDKGKMVRSFARLGAAENEVTEEKDKGEKILTYTLRPLSDKSWKGIRDDLYVAKRLEAEKETDAMDIPRSEVNSMYDVTTKQNEEKHLGLVLDAGREVRLKLYMGQVFMGWVWFIPAFHMPQPSPASSFISATKSTLLLTRKEVDFPLGIGQGLVDVAIDLEWVMPMDSDAGQEAPPRASTGESLDADISGSLGAAVQIVAGEGGTETGGSAVREAVEVKQGVEK